MNDGQQSKTGRPSKQSLTEKRSASNTGGFSRDAGQSEERPAAANVQDFDADGVSLVEEVFAKYYDESGMRYDIKKFTWENKNKIQVQVINYGARIIAIKLPDRKGEIEDVLLGFDDLAGYLFYEKLYLGSIIGRVTNVIKNSAFVIERERFSINANHGKHSRYGGFKGLDKSVWDTYVTGKKVIMSHISPHLTEGYPGDLLVRVVFELSAKNEFKVSFDAQTTRPTCIDLSQLLYFNLAGHHAGPDEVYKHILTLNCNCFTPQVNKIPTGEILNVIHTEFDFQVPKILGKVMGIVPKDGFDQNLCVNRGMYQNECFVGRLLHPPSGRMLEIYSNQPGLQLNTANDFGYGNILSMDEIKQQATSNVEEPKKSMILFEKVHEQVNDVLALDAQQEFGAIKELIHKFSRFKSKTDITTSLNDEPFHFTPMQKEYLMKASEIICENEHVDEECLNLKDILSAILKNAEVIEQPSTSSIKSESSKQSDPTQSTENLPNEKSELVTTISPKPSKAPEEKSKTNENPIPIYYKYSNQIRGKERALYKTHGGIALQTQNYPNAVNIKHFPTPVLNPGEVYRHDIVYRFWIRSGNPNKWIKRNLNECKQRSNKY